MTKSDYITLTLGFNLVVSAALDTMAPSKSIRKGDTPVSTDESLNWDFSGLVN